MTRLPWAYDNTPARPNSLVVRGRPKPAAAPGPDPSAWEQGNAAIADVTRWGWLPALSGVSIAADHAARAHGQTAGAAGEG